MLFIFSQEHEEPAFADAEDLLDIFPFDFFLEITVEEFFDLF
jgi:hypothetical protein